MRCVGSRANYAGPIRFGQHTGDQAWPSTGPTPSETTGIFRGFEPFVCGDDAEAIELARRLCDGHDIELWCLERMVILPAITEKNGRLPDFGT
jgi:hypothetical protein